MLTKYFIGINWVDFLLIALVLRMAYIGFRTGIGIELFKLFGLWLATILSYQFYTTPLSDFLNTKVPALPLDVGDVFVFVVVVIAVTIVVRIIRESFFLLVKIEGQNSFNKWGGLAVGCLRGLWIASLCLFIMTISTVEYLEVSAKSSLFGNNLINLAPSIYRGSYEGLILKFTPGGKINEEVFKAVER